MQKTFGGFVEEEQHWISREMKTARERRFRREKKTLPHLDYPTLTWDGPNMWCIVRFSTMCTILKTWKTPMEEYYFCRLKPATLLKVTVLHGCFSRFLNCTNGTKSRNTPHIRSKVWLRFLKQRKGNLLQCLTAFKSDFNFWPQSFVLAWFSQFHF